MTGIAERLRARRLDKDNFPRMESERVVRVKEAGEAADTIDALVEALEGARTHCRGCDGKGIAFNMAEKVALYAVWAGDILTKSDCTTCAPWRAVLAKARGEPIEETDI